MVNAAKLIIHMMYFRQMKHYVWLLIALMACSQPQNADSNSKPSQSIKPEFAQGFSIDEYDVYYQLTLFNPSNQTDTLGIFKVSKENDAKLACLSTTHVSFIHKLQRIEQLKGVAFANFIRNDSIQALVQSGSIIDLAANEDVSIEKLIGIAPDWFFVYPFGYDGYEKYTSKGIKCIPVSEYLEPHPLGRLEWIKVFALFCGEFQRANDIFETAKNEYQKTAQLVASSTENRPCVFTGSMDNGVWFAPPGNSFVGTLIQDAGASYVLADSLSNENIQIPFERLFQIAADCEFWGRVEFSTTPITYGLIQKEDPRLSKTRAFSSKNIFSCNTANTDYFGDAVLEPQVFLKDLVNIFHPNLLENQSNKYFFKLEN